MRHLLRALLGLLAIALGASAAVYGELDDSPGLFGLGLLILLGGVILGVRAGSALRKELNRDASSH
jgi:hypothetical protein